MEKKVRILWVTNAFGCGGAERQILYMYEILKNNKNMDISIIYYAHVEDELKISGVNAVYIDKEKEGKLGTIKKIREYIKKNEIDIVHTLGGCSANIYGRAGAIFTNAKIIGAVVGKHNFDSLPFRVINSLLNVRGKWWTVNNIELIPILKKKLAFVNDGKVKLIRNGFLPASKVDYRKNEVTEYDIDKGDNFTFTVIGRLDPIKNYGLFISAANEILKEHKNVRFWIIGNGSEYGKLKELANEYGIEDYVRFWGYRSDTDVALSRTDVFVQTSFTEGSPNTIAEAMRAGKPIISTRSTDLSEMIHEGKNGYVVPVDDLKSLIAVMSEILKTSRRDRVKMGQYSVILFKKYFLDQAVIKEYIVFYKTIMLRK